MELLKIFLIGVAGTIAFMFGLQLFARWRTKRIVGREIPRKFGREGILYFYSPRCGVCRRMEPVIESISGKVKVRRVDVSQRDGLELARSFGILGTPTTVVFKEGKVKKVFLGFQKEEKLLQEVRS